MDKLPLDAICNASNVTVYKKETVEEVEVERRDSKGQWMKNEETRRIAVTSNKKIADVNSTIPSASFALHPSSSSFATVGEMEDRFMESAYATLYSANSPPEGNIILNEIRRKEESLQSGEETVASPVQKQPLEVISKVIADEEEDNGGEPGKRFQKLNCWSCVIH